MTSVTVYHKPDCVQCDATMRRLAERGLAFATVDLTADPDALARATSAGHRSAPVVLVDGVFAWSGFRPDLIDALAKQEGGL